MDAFQKFTKINILTISNIELAKWIRENFPEISLRDCVNMTRLLKESHRLGVIRGELIKK